MLGRSSSSPGCDRPKSLKQVVTAPVPALGNRRECHGSSEMTLKRDVSCHNMFDMLQTMATYVKYKLKFAPPPPVNCEVSVWSKNNKLNSTK